MKTIKENFNDQNFIFEDFYTCFYPEEKISLDDIN
jgi:hypothetical protein